MTNLLEPPSIDPKGFPTHYFQLYETPNGPDCILVFYRKHEWKNGEYCAVEGTDFKKKVEVRTFLNRGMPPGF
jgi:hypothetical protein